MSGTLTKSSISARIERLPFSQWHLKMMSLAGIAHFSDAFDSLAIAFVLPVLAGLWKIEPAEIGLLISAGYIGQMAGAVGFGWFAERYGRRSSLRITVAVISVLSFACALSWNYASFFVFRLIQGLGLGGEVPVAATYMNEVSAARFRGRAVVLLQSSYAFGIVITSLVAIWIVPHLGWQWMFYIGAVPAVLALVLRRLMPESPRWLAGKGQLAEADKTLTDVEASITQGGGVLAPPVSLPEPAAQTASFGSLFETGYAVRTLAAWGLMLCTSIVGYSLLTWTPTIYRTVLKLPMDQTLHYGFASSVASLLGVLFTAYVVDKIGRRAAFSLGFFGTAVALLILAQLGLQTSPFNIAALVCVGLFFISILLGGLYLYVPEIYPTRMRALGSGVASAWLRIGAIIGPSIVGFVLGRSGLGAVFLTFALVSIVGGLIMVFLAVETRGKVLEEVAR